MSGLVTLDVHRKFLPSHGKYLHWLQLTFPSSGATARAQVLLPGRLGAALAMVERGASAAFVNSPVHRHRKIEKLCGRRRGRRETRRA